MKELFLKISEQTVLDFLLVAVLLFVILRIVHQGLKVNMRNKKANPIFNRFFPLFEFTVWTVFLIWGAKQIFQTGTAGSIILVVMMMGVLTWAGSFVVRDWIAGVVFKAEDRYRIDDIVSFQNTRGRLTNLGYRSLMVETSDGRTVEIPYSSLVRESTIEKIPRETACAMFRLSVPAQEPFTEIQQQLQAIALCAPWTSITRKPHIRIIERQESHYLVEVAAHLIDQTFAPEAEAYVTHYFNKRN
ncbi:MAG: mechanosensitive ion channel family protein [Desulfobacteraceae bacterium]|nr:MAG: mechanosensitive ion channel family protein [Desulfobacteraceae bacterium]